MTRRTISPTLRSSSSRSRRLRGERGDFEQEVEQFAAFAERVPTASVWRIEVSNRSVDADVAFDDGDAGAGADARGSRGDHGPQIVPACGCRRTL